MHLIFILHKYLIPFFTIVSTITTNAMKSLVPLLSATLVSALNSTSTTTSSIPLPTPKFRISPLDGSIIALPTKQQLAFQALEYGVLIHFEMGTYLSIDGCNNVPSLVPNLTLFDPVLLNTDQWMDSIRSLGAKYATLVAKHNCGFTTWPSNVTFTTRDNTTIKYNYTIANSPVKGKDVVKMFSESAEKYGIGHGLYYSTVVNNFLNVQGSEVLKSWAQGQVRISNSTYDSIVVGQLTELWSGYGGLTEVSFFYYFWLKDVGYGLLMFMGEQIWFDGGYSAAQQATYVDLLAKLQPDAVIFNACDVTSGDCLTENSGTYSHSLL
jgi:alpha-L-fucosidase